MQTFYKALVAVTEPQLCNVHEPSNIEYQTGNDSASLADVKRVKRHENTKNAIQRNRILLLPQGQLEGIPGVLDGDACRFEVFTQPLHTVTTPKKQLASFLEKRSRTSISNIKMQHAGEETRMFRPIKHLNWYLKPPPPLEREFKESASLRFSPDARRKARIVSDKNQEDLDLTLTNIKNFLEAGGKRVDAISPEIARQIDKFENLNDLEKPPNFDDGGEKKQPQVRRRARARKR